MDDRSNCGGGCGDGHNCFGNKSCRSPWCFEDSEYCCNGEGNEGGGEGVGNIMEVDDRSKSGGGSGSGGVNSSKQSTESM